MTDFNMLVSDIARGNVVLFIGSGLSIGAGVPSWKRLVLELSKDINYKISPSKISIDDFLKIPQYFEYQYGRNRLIDTLSDQINSVNAVPTINHKLLAQLPIHTWITTNWDDLIENTLRECKKKCRIIIDNPGFAYSADEVCLIKMHGDLRNPGSIVITKEDYYQYFLKHPLLKIKLESMLLDKTFLFVGYSVNDPDFNQICSEIRFHLREHQRRAYMIVTHDIDPLTEKDLNNSCIYLIKPSIFKTKRLNTLTAILKLINDRVKSSLPFEFIRNQEERTTRIVEMCTRLYNSLDLKKKEGYKHIIRIQATLSSFAISNEEKHDNQKYRNLLLEERDTLIKLAKAGVKIRCIISPLLINITRKHSKVYFKARLKQLLKFLDDKQYINTCEFVTFNEPKSNQMIFDNDAVLEGTKLEIDSGFRLTVIARDRAKTDFEIYAFDELFDNMKRRLIYSSGKCELSKKEEQIILRDMVRKEVQQALNQLLKN